MSKKGIFVTAVQFLKELTKNDKEKFSELYGAQNLVGVNDAKIAPVGTVLGTSDIHYCTAVLGRMKNPTQDGKQLYFLAHFEQDRGEKNAQEMARKVIEEIASHANTDVVQLDCIFAHRLHEPRFSAESGRLAQENDAKSRKTIAEICKDRGILANFAEESVVLEESFVITKGDKLDIFHSKQEREGQTK